MADQGQDNRNRSDLVADYSRGAEDAGYVDNLVAAPPQPTEGGAAIPVGERIKAIRLEKGLSAADLATRTGLTEAEVHQVEDELVSPNLGTLIKLSKALDMKMGTFISQAGPKPFTIVRHDARKAVSRYAKKEGDRLGYSYQHLAFDKGDRNMEPFFITLEPTEAHEERSSHDGEEFIFVLSGQMEAHLGDTVEILNPGDSIYYSSSLPHLVKCHGGQEAQIVAVIYASS